MKKVILIFLIFIINIFSTFAQKTNIKKLYLQLHDSSLNYEALYQAIKVKQIISPPNDSIIVIVDFTKPSSEKRFFIINIKTPKILKKTYVAHGKGSGENYVKRFSNTPHTGASSPGFYLTMNTYIGKHGYSLKLKGLEKGINDNAMKRAIVIHQAWYVSEDFIKKYGRLGRSQGCFALQEGEAKEIIDLIKNGTLLYAYTTDENYVKNSPLLKQINQK